MRCYMREAAGLPVPAAGLQAGLNSAGVAAGCVSVRRKEEFVFDGLFSYSLRAGVTRIIRSVTQYHAHRTVEDPGDRGSDPPRSPGGRSARPLSTAILVVLHQLPPNC
jgi:hypothetical protein